MKRRTLLNGLAVGSAMALTSKSGLAQVPDPRSPAVIDVTTLGFAPAPADNSGAQEIMRRHAIAHPGTAYRFPPGDYDLTTPRFLFGVNDIEIIAHGARFRNVNAGNFGYSDLFAAFYIGSGSVFHPMGGGNLDPGEATSGELIHSARAGDVFVTLMAPRRAADFEKGGWALLHWFSRQKRSFPPNPAYFDYVKVVLADPTTGRLELDRPLTFDYSSAAPDDPADAAMYGTTTGPARILSLDRPDYRICERFVLRGGKGLRLGTKVSPDYDGVLAISGAINVEIYDANFEGFFPSMVRSVRANRSVFDGGSEVDKIIENAVLEDCVVTDLTQGTGARRFEMQGGRLLSSGRDNWSNQIRSREIILRNVEVAAQNPREGGAQINMDAYAKSLVIVSGCAFYPNPAQRSAIGLGGAPAFVPDALTRTTMTIARGNPASEQIMRAIDVGSTISLETGKDPEIFTVAALAFDASGTLVLTGTFAASGSPDPKARRLLRTTQKFIDTGNNRVVDPPPGFKLLPASRTIAEPRFGNATGPRTFEFQLEQAEFFGAPIQGYVTNISVDVLRPYSGTDEPAVLELANFGVGKTHDFGSINVKIAGARRASLAGAYGAGSGDRWTSRIPERLWVELLSLHLHGNDRANFKNSGSGSPRIFVRVKTV